MKKYAVLFALALLSLFGLACQDKGLERPAAIYWISDLPNGEGSLSKKIFHRGYRGLYMTIEDSDGRRLLKYDLSEIEDPMFKSKISGDTVFVYYRDALFDPVPIESRIQGALVKFRFVNELEWVSAGVPEREIPPLTDQVNGDPEGSRPSNWTMG